MIITASAPTIPSALVRNIGFMAPYAPLEVPSHLIASGGANSGSLHLSSSTPPRCCSAGSAEGSGGVAGTPPANGSGGMGDHHTLTNGTLTIGVKNAGAELTSLRSERTGLEYLWQAGPAWNRHSPVLFPIVGRLKGNAYMYRGTLYKMDQHGLAREMRFEPIVKTAESILFRLRYGEKTLEQYPFKFELKIGYALEDDALQVNYEVKNLDGKTMFFSIGAHPGFRCPLIPTEEYEDYHLVWDEDVRLMRHFLEDGLVAPQTEPLMLGERELRLTRDMFDRDAIVLKNVDFKSVRLINRETGHGVTMSMKGFPYFGIWATPKANFVCLEPWYGVADSADATGYLEDKEGIIALGGKDSFRASYTIKPS